MGGHTMDVDKLDDFDNWFGAIHDQTGNDNPATTTAHAENVSSAPSKKVASPAKRVRPRPGGGGAAERLMSGQSIMDSAGMSERLAEARMRVQKAKEEKQSIADRSTGRRRRTKESITRFLDSLDDDDGLGTRSNHGNRRSSLDRSRPTLRSDPLGASSHHTAARARDPLGASSHHANMRRRGSNDSEIPSGQPNTYSRMRRRGSNESDIPSSQPNNYSKMRRRASNEDEASTSHHNGAVSDRSTSSRMTGRVSVGDESCTSQASNGKEELNVSRRPRRTRSSASCESEDSQGPPAGSQERRLSSGAEYEQPDETSGGSNPQSGSMSGRSEPPNTDEKLSELGMKVSVSPSSDDGTVLVQMDKETLSRLLENAGINEDSVVPVPKPRTRSDANNERPESNDPVEHINSDNEIELKSSNTRSDEKSSTRKSDHLRSSRHGSKSSSHGDDGSRDAVHTDRRRQMHRKESHRRMERSETKSDEVPTTDRRSQLERGASRRRVESRDDGIRDISSSRHSEGMKVKIPNKDRRSQLERGTSRRMESNGEGISSSRHHDGIKVKVPNTDRRSQLERGSSRRRVESKGDGSRDISSSRHRGSSHSSKDTEGRRRSSSQGPLSNDRRRSSRSESSSSSAPRRSRSTSRARHPDRHRSSSTRGESRTRRRDSSRTRSSGSESNGDKVSKRETANDDNTGTLDRRAQMRRVTSSRDVESQPRRVKSVGSQPISSSLHSDQLAQRGGAIPTRKPLDRRAMMMRSCSNPVLVKRKTETDMTGKMGDLHF